MSGEFSGDVAVIGRARPARKGLSWGPARDTPPGPSANAWTQPCRLLPHPARARRRARLGTHSPQKSRAAFELSVFSESSVSWHNPPTPNP